MVANATPTSTIATSAAPTRRARGDRAGGRGVRNHVSELVGQPELPLRPDPRAGCGPHDDRLWTLPDERQGVLQGPLVLGQGAGPGDLLASVLRGAERRGRPGARAQVAGAARRRRDDRLRRPCLLYTSDA